MTLHQNVGRAVARHLVDLDTYTAPVPLYLALLADGVEVSGAGTGYQRQIILFAAAVNLPDGSTEVRNDEEIVFPDPLGNWGTITGFQICDAASAGTAMVDDGALEAPLTIDEESGPLVIKAGRLVLAMQPDRWSQQAMQKIMNLIFAGGMYKPADLYIALLDGAPTVQLTGDTLDEPGPGYSRAPFGVGGSNWADGAWWPVGKHGVTFGPATANWSQPVVGTALVDAPAGGVFLGWEDAYAINVQDGEDLEIISPTVYAVEV